MDPSSYPTIKEEYHHRSSPSTSGTWMSSGEPPPRPIEGLNEVGPPPFLTKTYEMVDDQAMDCVVSWSREGHSFVVWDPHAFSTTVLPRYFKHNNFSSFGFRKIDPDKWEFANESFLKGQKHLLKNIRRRKVVHHHHHHQSQPPAVEVGMFGVDAEISSLRRDKQVLMAELVKLRHQQHSTRMCLNQMELRLQSTEKKQQRMMSFLAKAMQNPDFVRQLMEHKEKRKEIEELVGRKRRRPIEAGESSRAYGLKGPIVKPEPSELEALALEMQGFGRANREEEEEEGEAKEKMEDYDEHELDEGFWDELLGEEGFRKNGEDDDDDGEEEKDVSILADRLVFLGGGSSPK